MTPVLKPNWNMPKMAEKMAKIRNGGIFEAMSIVLEPLQIVSADEDVCYER